MTDRDRFTLHILPGMPATREGAMRVAGTMARHLALHAELRGEWLSCPNCITPWKCNGPHDPGKPLRAVGL